MIPMPLLQDFSARPNSPQNHLPLETNPSFRPRKALRLLEVRTTLTKLYSLEEQSLFSLIGRSLLKYRGATLDPHRYIVVVPKMSDVTEISSSLQITTNYRVAAFYFLIESNDRENHSYHLSTANRSVKLDLNRLLLSTSDTYSRYLAIHADHALTVVLYIFSHDTDMSSSTLILPDIYFNSNMTDVTYFLHSSISKSSRNTVTSVSMSDNSTVVTVGLNGQDITADICATSLFTSETTKVTELNTRLDSLGNAMFVETSLDLTNVIMKTTGPVAVYLGTIGYIWENGSVDSTLDHLLPVEYTSTWYIVFPTPEVPEQNGTDIVRLVAIYENTRLIISLPNGTRLNTTMKYSGDVTDLMLQADKYYYIKGNVRFYAYKIHEDMSDSDYSGCQMLLPTSTSHYELHNAARFGAYLYATNNRSTLCHPLGIADKPTLVSNYGNYRYINIGSTSRTSRTSITPLGMERAEIVKTLQVNHKNISSYVRTKISAPDYRMSATSVGGVGIAILVLVGVVIVGSDLLYIFQLVKSLTRYCEGNELPTTVHGIPRAPGNALPTTDHGIPRAPGNALPTTDHGIPRAPGELIRQR
ncbi:hypothetical protein Btru_019942 [Bulinus truncatus]|nr:hypothetical protein Btru_019942 [Bulinus truncatus]